MASWTPLAPSSAPIPTASCPATTRSSCRRRKRRRRTAPYSTRPGKVRWRWIKAYDWLAGVQDILGEKSGLEFARAMARQGVRLQRSHTLLTQLMAAGEFKLIVDGYNYQLQTFKEKG